MSPAAVARRVAGKGAKLPRRRPVPHDRSEPILGGTAPKLPVSAATEPLALFPPVAARMDVADAVPAPALNAGSRTGAVEAEAVAAPPVALGPSAEAAPVETPPVAFAGAAMVPPASDRSRGRLSLSVVASLLIHGGVLAFALYLGVKVADMPATGEDAVAVEIVAGEPAAVADTASGAEAAASENAASETQPVEMPVEEPPPQQVAEPPPPVVEPPPPQLTEAPPQAAPEPAPPAPEPSPIQAAVPPPQPVTPPPPVRREPPVVRREQRPVRAAVTPHRETRPAPRAEAASRRAAPDRRRQCRRRAGQRRRGRQLSPARSRPSRALQGLSGSGPRARYRRPGRHCLHPVQGWPGYGLFACRLLRGGNPRPGDDRHAAPRPAIPGHARRRSDDDEFHRRNPLRSQVKTAIGLSRVQGDK